MPRVKIDYVVSFSSEDSDNQANNLLAWDVSRKKWLCNKGESSCSIVLQLVKAVKIESINIGACHAALIEVLVGLSEKPNDPFEVIVPNSVLLSPSESRRDDGIERVRSFSGDQLTSTVRARRWDRVRVVCSQPYNKHCKYGLSFIHIFEPEDTTKCPAPTAAAPSIPSRLLQLDTFSSDEDEFRPGELFALSQSDKIKTSTDAQIRKASSQALKNISDSATKLQKTPIFRCNKDQNRVSNECTNRKKESLMYDDEDDEPHAKIDRIVQQHKDNKKEDKPQSAQKDKNKKKDKNQSIDNTINDKNENKKNKTPHEIANESVNNASASHKRKRSKTNENNSDLVPGPILPLSQVLSGVEFAISGYVNPERSTLRTTAMELGAVYQKDWRPSCTHLICAFPNTPKLKVVRSRGARTVAVGGEWLRACAQRRRRLPWQWYATEPQRRVAAPGGWEEHNGGEDEHGGGEDAAEMDTDDEIETVLKKQKKKRLKSPIPDTVDSNDHKDNDEINKSPKLENVTNDPNVSGDSDVAFVKDERIQANITISESDSDTEEEERADGEDVEEQKELPNFFDGLTFLISDDLEGGYDRALLERYVRAYGGVVLREAELLEESKVDYEVGGGGHCCCSVRPEWLWECHRAEQLASTAGFEL